jgi:hypothetical protein
MTGREVLLALLDEAIALVAAQERLGGFYVGHATAAEFAAELESLRNRVARGDRPALERVRGIFTATSAWDDTMSTLQGAVGQKATDLANRIWVALPFG